MNTKKIFINQEEEIISIVDKILQPGEQEIVLFLPRGAQVFLSNVNLKLLKREADNAGKKLIIVTEDETGQKMALKNGFVVFGSREQFSFSSFGEEEKTEVASEQKSEPAPLPALASLPTKASEKEVKKTDFANEANRVIDLRSGNVKKISTDDIIPAKRDENYFEKLIEEKNHFRRIPLADSEKTSESEDLSLSIDLSADKEGEFEKPLSRNAPLPDDSEPGQFAEEIKIEDSRDQKKETKKSFFGVLESLKATKKKPEGPTAFSPAGFEAAAALKTVKESPTALLEAPKKKIFRLSVVFAALGLIGFLAVIYFILPKAEVSLTQKRENAVAAFFAAADKEIGIPDTAKMKVPAKILEVKKTETRTFPATGEKQINQKATGVITVYNAYSSSPQTLVETTRLVSDGGKLFRTRETVTVPGAKVEDGEIIPSAIDVSVEADEAGDGFNIGPDNFVIPGFKGSPKYEKFYGRSAGSMSGGKVGTAKFVTQDDMAKAIERFAEENTLDLVGEIKEQVPEKYVLLDECVAEQESLNESKVKVGDLAESFEIVFDFSIEAIAFSGEAVKQLAAEKLGEGIFDKNKKIEEESVLIEYKEVSPDFAKGRVELYLSVMGNFTEAVDVAEIKENLAGKNLSEIKDYLSGVQNIQEGEVSFWPFFVRSAPENVERIEITVD